MRCAASGFVPNRIAAIVPAMAAALLITGCGLFCPGVDRPDPGEDADPLAIGDTDRETVAATIGYLREALTHSLLRDFYRRDDAPVGRPNRVYYMLSAQLRDARPLGDFVDDWAAIRDRLAAVFVDATGDPADIAAADALAPESISAAGVTITFTNESGGRFDVVFRREFDPARWPDEPGPVWRIDGSAVQAAVADPDVAEPAAE
jgi:hypothetical protein